jgi:nucleoside-diphosphate-sugar epimerase
MTEDLPDRPVGAKARVRAAAAGLLRAAHRDGALPMAIVRAPDFFGPHVEQSALGRRQFAAAVAGRPVPILGDPDQPHAFCYLDDLAAAMVTVAERPDAWGETWHAPCPPPVTQAKALATIAGRRVAVRRASRPMLTLGGLVSPALRELKEIVYQFDRPFEVDCRRIADRLGLVATPFETAITATRQAYGLRRPGPAPGRPVAARPRAAGEPR